MLRRLVTSGVFVLFAVVAVPASVGQAVSASPRSTTSLAPTGVVHLRPVDAHGHLQPGYQITKRHGRAHCLASSEATGNAYRCFAGNLVYDPCWVGSSKKFVICLSAPWSYHVAQLHVTKGYDNAGRTTKPAKLPWGVQTPDGQLCGYLQGAGGVVAGKRINYGCQHVKYVLIGNVDQSHRVWRIRKARPTGGGHFKQAGWADLSKAWFGKASRKG